MKFLVRLVPDSTQCLLVALRSLSTKQYSNLGSQANILFTILLCKDCNSLNAIKQVATSRRGTKQFLNIVVELALQLYQTDSLVYLKFVFLSHHHGPFSLWNDCTILLKLFIFPVLHIYCCGTFKHARFHPLILLLFKHTWSSS